MLIFLTLFMMNQIVNKKEWGELTSLLGMKAFLRY